MTIVVGLFERPHDAERAIDALESAGFVQDEISALAQDRIIKEHLEERKIEPVEVTTGLGAIGGSAIGGLAGLLAGVGAITIPGIGAVLAAGALASTLAGAVVGGSAGGLVGALIGMGVPEEGGDDIGRRDLQSLSFGAHSYAHLCLSGDNLADHIYVALIRCDFQEVGDLRGPTPAKFEPRSI